MPDRATATAPLPISGAKNGIIATLQAGRAIAALMVVLYHNGIGIFAKDKYWGSDPFDGFFEFGTSGVMFFFVLSGFIILHVHWNDLGIKEKFLLYIKKRFVRIYPIYWVVLLPLALIYFLVPSFGDGYERDFFTILSSALLVHIKSGYTIVRVAWTLFHEILFYGVFALAIYNKRAGILFMAAWFAATILMLPWAPTYNPNDFSNSGLSFYMSPLHLLFGMGMALCWALRREKVLFPKTLAALGCLAFLAVGIDEDYTQILESNARALAYGFSCTVALAGFIELERQKRLTVPKALVLMGNASYSIYLIHFPVMIALAKVFCAPEIKNYIPVHIAYVLLPTLALTSGIILHLIIEKPLLNKLNKVMSLRKR